MQFASLNSWDDPHLIYQAEHPVEIVTGRSGEWDKLRAVLHRYRDAADSPHPRGAAVGWIAYDGSYQFGLYPHLRTLSRDWNNPAWRERRARSNAEVNIGSWRSNLSAPAYEQIVRRAQDYIAAGHIYQVNLAQKFSCELTGNPYALFEQLMWRSPAPGGAFLDLGDRQILCASPELFLRVQGRRIETRPIKGTRPRSRDALRDQQLGYELMTDPKELAELVMITDLERNDLGQVSSYGSVHVTDLLRLERYAQVYHLVSTVEGHLRPEIDTIAAIAACFPGGSITGAPKKRAREIIAELEPEPRGLYTGAIGYIGFNGDATFSMTIRTLILEQNQAHFHVGSGITADSVPAREYEETIHKASGMQLAVAEYERAEKSRERGCQPPIPSHADDLPSLWPK
jgi:para-aminobenzoate synthetase component I